MKKRPKLKKYTLGGPNDEFNSAYDQSFNSTSNTVSAINPLYGAATKAMGMIGKPIRQELDKTETGRKINYGMGWAFSPLEMAVTSNKTGIWSPKEYNQAYEDQEQSVKANSLLPADGKFKHGGQTFQVNAPSHENGGQVINSPNGQYEIEKQEAVKVGSTSDKILSDSKSLKLPSTGKTPALSFKPLELKKVKAEKALAANKYIPREQKNSLEFNIETANKKFDLLFNEQEALKQRKFESYAKKLGINLPSFFNKQQEFRNGGIKQYEDGGEASMIREYQNEGYNDFWGDSPAQAYSRQFNQDKINRINIEQLTPSGELTTPNPYSNETVYDPSKNYTGGKMLYTPKNDSYEQAMKAGKEWNVPEGDKRDYTQAIEPAVNAIVQNVGNIAYLAQQGKKYDKVNYGSVKPKLPSYKESLRQANQESAMARNNIKNITGGSGGAAMSNFVANQTANTLNKARIIEQGENAIAGVSNNMAQFNKANEIQGMSDEASNKGQALSNYYKAIEGIGRNTSAAYTDYKKGQMDINTAKMLNSAFANYGLDINNPYHWNIFYKKTQDDQKLGATSNVTSTTPGVPSNVNSYSGMKPFKLGQ